MEKLEKKVCELLRKQDIMQNHNCVTIKGVKNLSRTDLETILLYCDTIRRYGTYEGRLMEPLGGVGEVLAKYKVI